MLSPCRDLAEFQEALAQSQQAPVVLFKHSTRCSISAAARAQLLRFAELHPDVACWEVLVIEQRPLSATIAETTGIPHASPQALVLFLGRAVWSTSHHAITAERLHSAIEQTRAGG